jgi:hypothetical protein
MWISDASLIYVPLPLVVTLNGVILVKVNKTGHDSKISIFFITGNDIANSNFLLARCISKGKFEQV